MILTPFPFPVPDRVVHILEGSDQDRYHPGRENSLISARGGSFQDWREQSHSFESTAAARLSQRVREANTPIVVDSLLAADLMLARTLERAREFAVREALRRYARHYKLVLAESIVLAERSGLFWALLFRRDVRRAKKCFKMGSPSNVGA